MTRRHEVKDQGITVTCLMPGATEPEFFEKADMLDTRIGQAKKGNPAGAAQDGHDAMMRGVGDIVSGSMNKAVADVANITPAGAWPQRRPSARKLAAASELGKGRVGGGLGYRCKTCRNGASMAADSMA